MFGPNTHFTTQVNIDYSHRDPRFFELFANTRAKFAEKFQLHDYDILFLPGSGTVGIEAVMYSLKKRVEVIGHDGVFTRRWKRMAEQYNSGKKGNVQLYCQLETSASEVHTGRGGLVDAISAFPYYPVPEDTPILVTASNKLLNSYAGLAIVAVRKDYWSALQTDARFSYLNLARYREYHDRNQTPSTAPTYLYEHFHAVIEDYDVAGSRERIDQICDLIVETVGVESIVGEKRGPVITIRREAVPRDVAEAFDLYGHWTGKPVHQIFTYSCRYEDYAEFCRAIRSKR